MIDGDFGFAAQLLGGLGSGILGIDADGKLALVNAGAQRILHLPEGGLGASIGTDCRSALAAQPALARLLLAALDGRDALSRAELVLEGDGEAEDRTIGFTLVPLRERDGCICGSAMLFRDLTPFERCEEQERLRDRLAALGEMAAGLAHEIRNPLAGMELLAGMLRRRVAERPEERALVDDLMEQLHELAQTVSDSLEFVRPVALVRKPEDPRALVERALEESLRRAPAPDRIERCFAGPLRPIPLDAELMRVAIGNLIVNACEAMAGADDGRPTQLVLGLCERDAPHAARAVRVGSASAALAVASPPTRELVISVADTGPGVAPSLREKIFYPFFTTKQRGSGVGLATVQKIALAHGGSVALEHPAHGGCTLRMHLPLDAERT
jgi:signal transduction histidine kinase